MLVTSKKLLDKANKKGYAVGAFNINNMEILQAVVMAAEKLNAPVILQTSEGAIKYAGLEYLFNLAKIAAETSKADMAIHLDHGKNLDLIKNCIRIGYTSVMIDASQYDFERNVMITRKVVSMAHGKRVSVEAELGTIGGAEDLVKGRKILYTDPYEAKEFAERTGIDALAVAIGTSHGAYKFVGKPRLDFKRLKEIKQKVKIPLVLHGGSGVPKDVVARARMYGAKIPKTQGVPDSQIRKAIKYGINKINTDTDLRVAFDAAVRETLKKHPEDFDPRHILGPAREYMQKIVEKRIRLFGSGGES